MDPTTFSGGPAFLTWDGITLQMHEDWQLSDGREFFDVSSNLQGYLSSGLKDDMMKVLCRPIAFSGSIATLFAKLFPYTALRQGELVFTDTAKPMVIQTARGGTDDLGLSLTLANVRVFASPAINFDPDKPFFDEFEFVALLAPDAELGDAGSFLTVADSTYVEPTLTPTDILYDNFSLAWGSSAPFDDIVVVDGGIKFTPDWNLQPRKRKTLTYNYQVNAPTAKLAFTPENIGLEDFFATLAPLEGSTVRLGKVQHANAQKLTVIGSASGRPYLTLPLAFAEQPGAAKFAGTGSALDAITMRGVRQSTSTVSATTANGDATITVTTGDTRSLRAGMGVSGTGIAGGAKILSITDATHFELTANATADGEQHHAHLQRTASALHPGHRLTAAEAQPWMISPSHSMASPWRMARSAAASSKTGSRARAKMPAMSPSGSAPRRLVTSRRARNRSSSASAASMPPTAPRAASSAATARRSPASAPSSSASPKTACSGNVAKSHRAAHDLRPRG